MKRNNADRIRNFKINAPSPQINQEAFGKIIKDAKNRKAPGPDQVPNRLIKFIFRNDPEYLTNLYNRILRSGELPAKWEVGRMIYFTKPNRRLRKVTDLRSITLINDQLKNGETLLARAIESELNRLNFFEPNQFGFRTGASAVQAIEKVTKEVKNSRKRIASVTHLD